MWRGAFIPTDEMSVNADGRAMNVERDRRLALPLFFLVLAVYVFTYVGAFKSNDERALFSGTDSFVKRGEFTVNQIYWDYTNVGMLTSAGDMVPNYEPAQMLLAAPFYVWGRALGAAVQGTMFFSAVALAAAAALVYLCLLELGYGRRSGLLGALVFAFATLAWPYSRTFFREPLTVFAYLGAVYGLLRYRFDHPRRMRWPALAGGMLGLALLTKQISVALIPTLLVLAVAAEWRRPGTWRERAKALVASAVPLAACLLVGLWYNRTTLAGVETFARDIVDYTTNPQLSQSVPIRMLRALVGLSVSPYKGLFWYAPVLLLGMIGAIPFTRRDRWTGLAFIGLVFAHLLGYSRYNYWSGGVAWGSRYMLPVIPFLVLLAAPVWAWLMGTSKGARERRSWGERLLSVAVWGLIFLSAAVQVLGISVDLRTWEVKWLLEQSAVYGGIGQAIEALYLVPAQSPVVGHARLLFSGTQPLDFAWVQWRPEGTWAFVPAGFILSLGLVGLALSVFAIEWRHNRTTEVVTLDRQTGRATKRTWGLAGAMALATAAVCTVLVLIYRQGDARFDTYNVDAFLQPMVERLEADGCAADGLDGGRCNDVFLMPDPALTDYFLNYLGGRLPWYALEARPVDEALARQLLARYGRIWLGRDRNAETDDAEDRRDWERYLTGHAYKVGEERYGDWARLLAFSAAGRPAEDNAPGATLGEFTLERARLGVERRAADAPGAVEPLDDGRVQARSGDTLQVGLEWRAGRKPDANYTAFVQLLDASSQVVAQRDRWPGDGLYPTAALEAGQVLTDNLALALDAPPGSYRLIAGFYRGDAEGLPRLNGPGGDHVVLAEVDVR
jgi:hypothetical protein